MKKTLLLLWLLTSAQTLNIFAQSDNQPIIGTDTFKYKKYADAQDCFVYERYVIKTVSSDGNGFYINVYKKNTAALSLRACEIGRAKPYLVVKDSDSEFFGGLVGDKMIIDDGTGPNSRELRIVDLRTKKNIYTAIVRELGKVIGKRFLNFSEFSKIKRQVGECPQASKWRKDGFDIGWIQSAKLDLQTMRKTSAGKVSCTALQ